MLSSKAQRRQYLWILIGVFALLGLTISALPFVRSLQPTQQAISNSIYVIPLEGNTAGVHFREDTPFGELWVIRRSEEQIDRLLSSNALALADWINDPEARLLPNGVDQHLRSHSPEWFVFIAWGDIESDYLLREGPGQYIFCKNMQYFEGLKQVDETSILGGIQCDAVWGRPTIFDLTGRSSKDWVWPLVIPNYEIQDNEIVVRPAT